MSSRLVSIVSQAVQVAKKSGGIIRNLFQKGDWGIVDKVIFLYFLFFTKYVIDGASKLAE